MHIDRKNTTVNRRQIYDAWRRNQNNIVNIENSKRLYCTCKQVNDPMKPMVHCEKCWNWFHWDCVGYKDSPRKDGLDYMCKECQTVIGRERNCDNEAGMTAFESQTTTDEQFIHPIPSNTVNNESLHNNNILQVKNKNMIHHMNNTDTNDSKYTTDFCDTEQHKPDKEECHDIEMKDNHFEPSKIVLSDKCIPIIRSAMLRENTNESHLNQNSFDEFKIEGLENSVENDGSYNDFDSITTTYAEDQKLIIDKPKLEEHSEPIYDTVSASFTVKQDITQQVDEHNHDKINISHLPNNNIRSYTISIKPEIWCNIFANGNLLIGYTNCFADHFRKVNTYCPLVFKYKNMRKSYSRRLSPYIHVVASCKFNECCNYHFLLDEIPEAGTHVTIVINREGEFCHKFKPVQKRHMLSNRYATLDHANSQRVCCTCKQVNAQMKPMVRCANCCNWFHCDCVDYNDIPRKDGLDYICQACKNVKGRESNCGNEVGATALESIITTKKEFMHPIPTSTANSEIPHNNNMIHVKNIVSHMSNNDTNYSKYTTNLCDIEQHDKEECQYIENEDNHFEPS